MKFKEHLKHELELLKKMGKRRREIENDLGYSEKYLDQVLSMGGNEKVLRRVQEYRERIEEQQNVLSESVPEYISEQRLIEVQKELIQDLRAEKLRLQAEVEELKKKNDRLEKQITLLFDQLNFMNSTSGKRRLKS